MSLKIGTVPEIPEETRRVAQAAFPKGNRWLCLRDEIGPLYADQEFADLFPQVGQPAAAPWRLALILVMQYAEGLSDEQAETSLRSRIDWKYALSLPLDDPGLDASVFSEFRTRLLAGGAQRRLPDKLLDLCRERQWLKERGRQRTDSTHVLAASRGLNRLENVGQTLRQALNVLATVAPEWLLAQAQPEWVECYKDRMDDYRLPKSESARLALAETIGRDGERLLAAIDQASAPDYLRALPTIKTLRQVWIQQYFPSGKGLVWRRDKEQGLSAAPAGIRSPHDPEARYSEKRGSGWVGYKVHLKESCDEDLPHLITQVETTIAPVPDSAALPLIQADLAEHQLLPAEQLADAGYVSACRLIESGQKGIDLCGPQAELSSSWQETTDGAGKEQIKIKFAVKTCRPCPRREQCTKIDRRMLTIQPEAETRALKKARLRAETKEYAKLYAQRAGVEGTISQTVRSSGLRRARYVGLSKTHLQHLAAAVATNVVRLVNWLTDVPLAKTRRSAFVKLMSAKPLAC